MSLSEGASIKGWRHRTGGGVWALSAGLALLRVSPFLIRPSRWSSLGDWGDRVLGPTSREDEVKICTVRNVVGSP
jgi:hypothetical protein